MPVDLARLGAEIRGGGDEIIDVPPHRLVTRVAEQLLCGGVPRRHLVVEGDRDDRRRADLQKRLEVLLLTVHIAQVVIDRVGADYLPTHEDRCGSQVDVHERSVLARAPSHELDLTIGDPPIDLDGLCVQLTGFGDQVVDVVPERLDLAVAEEILGGRIPDGDSVVEVGRHDGSGTELEERFPVLLLAAQLCLARLKRFVGKPLAP